MTPERAEEIVGAICDRSFVVMGSKRSAGSLRGVTLAEMIEAKGVIETRNREGLERQRHEGGSVSLFVVPDDRLIAAAYVIENYGHDSAPVVAQPNPKGGGWWRLLYVIARDGIEHIEDEE